MIVTLFVSLTCNYLSSYQKQTTMDTKPSQASTLCDDKTPALTIEEEVKNLRDLVASLQEQLRKLQEKVREQGKTIHELNQKLQEKDQVIQEKDQELQKLRGEVGGPY